MTLLDAPVIDHVAEIFAREGSNAWFSRPAQDLLPSPAPVCACGKSAWEKQHDIVDVWFESGVSWAAVADGKLVPAGEKVDLYLEGADQHRGWFHSSLLVSTATRGKAPYKAVLTHGWVLDERGKVYSKSEIARARAAGAKIDYVEPAVRMEKNGAELLRLWTAAGDYQNDIVFSETILNQLSESYRKIRNTCRYLLSNLYDFAPSRDRLDDDRLRELDLLALGLLRERDHQVFEAYKRYAFHEVVRLLNDFMVTVSAEYARPGQGRALLRGGRLARAPQRADRPLRDDAHARHLDGAHPLLHRPGRRRRARARDGRAVRRPRQRARRDLSARQGAGEPQQALARRDPPAPRGDPAAAREVPRRGAQVARSACPGHARAPPSARTGSGTWTTSPSWRSSRASSSIPPTRPPARRRRSPSTRRPDPTCPRCWRRTGDPTTAGAPDPNLCRRCAGAIAAARSAP